MDSDLTALARIRQSAIELFGTHGFARTTIRQIAEHASVSPGLVIHHYRSKEALADACDEFMLQTVFDEKNAAMAGAMISMRGYVAEHPEFKTYSAYFAARLRHGGPGAQRFFDRLCDLTESMLASAPFRKFADPRGVAAVLVAFSSGSAMLGKQLAHRLGGESLYDPDMYVHYGELAVQVLAAVMEPAFVDAIFKEQQ